MDEQKVKITVTCYLQGYGKWEIKIYKGSILVLNNYYYITVIEGIESNTAVTDKKYRFPVNYTIIIEH
jgi:hypothetical protein